ncbi:MAG: response regulator [Deltaproteobacteria bacterium]|nr:response regulator [Deltaproteobacteria bacterium]MBI3755198.1 response regulator [Deltaproteobacteria bacterium]
MITKDSKNIIVADDSEFFRVKLSDILTEAGHKVRIVQGGAELIKEIQINPRGIDMILLDLQMPNIDGFGVLEWINNNGFRGKFHILAITGVYETTSVMERLKKLGAEGLMTKAFTPEEIVFRVNKALFPDKAAKPIDPRIPVSFPVDFSIGDVTSTGYLLNISASGMFLHTKKTIFPGTVLHIRFTLPGSDKLLNIKGIVKWCTQMSGEKSLFGGAGIQFTKPSPEDRQMLKEFVEAELKKLGF